MRTSLASLACGGVLAALAPACESGAPLDPAPRTERAEQAIVGGTLDTTHDAVVALRETSAGDTLCSGTIISVDVARGRAAVLTAAHCIATRLPSVLLVGPDFAAAEALRFVPTDVRVHPQFQSSSDESPYDVGVVRFSGDVSKLQSISVASEGEPRPAVGDSVRALGFGLSTTVAGPDASVVDASAAADSSKRRVATITVTEASTDDFRFDQRGGVGICKGDSGGPLLLLEPNGEERVVGVHSRLIPTSESLDPCLGTGVSTRVTGMRDFLGDALAAADPSACTVCRAGSRSEGGSCLGLERACEGRPACAAVLPCIRHCTTAICLAQCLQSADPSETDALRAISVCPCTACSGSCPATDVCAPPPDGVEPDPTEMPSPIPAAIPSAMPLPSASGCSTDPRPSQSAHLELVLLVALCIGSRRRSASRA